MRDLRDWLKQVEAIGELKKISGAAWDGEMGALTELTAEKYPGKAPALLFDDVPGYPGGFRTLYGHFTTLKRVALTLNIPLEEAENKVKLVKAYQDKWTNIKPIPYHFVADGPILENVLTGGDIDCFKFPVPRHHQRDKARFIGTAACVITKDPDRDWYNLGTYRSQVYDAATIGCQITEGKHGRIHRDKYFERGETMKVAIVVGQDPLLYLLSASQVPEGVSEYDYAGAILGEPYPVIKGVYTGFPVPANAEIVIEGDITPGDLLDEGPFGEWMGYYCSAPVKRPCVRVKSIMHRNQPILCCAPQHKPVDETVLLKAVAGSAAIWDALRLAGIPDIKGVWQHEGGMGVRFLVISIQQRYPGHARQVLHVASSCQAGAYNGKWVIVVDEDIDPSNMDQVMWALTTRFDPVDDIDIIKKAWSSGRDPLVQTGNFNNRILCDACIPYHRKLKGDFPVVVEVGAEETARLLEKWKGILF
ncbi:UbiD family decarboxylase [Candidatus Formimonas warabiya]|nr:UbiD family decarboxylase [Candidatus Formimonas warabiya]